MSAGSINHYFFMWEKIDTLARGSVTLEIFSRTSTVIGIFDVDYQHFRPQKMFVSSNFVLYMHARNMY